MFLLLQPQKMLPARASATLLQQSSAAIQACSRRGMAAVKNWKRPSMEEYGVPKESWEHVNRKNQSKYNMYLAGGIVFFGVTMTVAKVSGLFFFNTTPYHLMDRK
jgi:hypothetical protein